MKREGLWEKLRLLNPKNLQREVHVYGYRFSWRTHLMAVIAALVGIGGIGMVFQLKPLFLAGVLLTVLFVFPVLVLDMYKKMYEQKRFGDACAYMEQLLYAFQKTGKIVSALKEVRGIFGEGQIRLCVEEAIAHMEYGHPVGEQGVLREGLQKIERYYACDKLATVHELLLNTEEYGGDVEASVTLVLEDIERFKKRGYQLQAEKRKSHTDNVISIVVAVLLCAAALYLLNEMQEMFTSEVDVSVFTVPVIQISSMVFLLLLLAFYVKSVRSLTADWLEEKPLYDTAYIRHSYELVMGYEKKAQQYRRLIPAGIVTMTAFVFWTVGWRIAGILLLVTGLLVAMQPRISYRIAERDVTAELYQVLPRWLFEMVLLLQNNNVQMAITKSEQHAPAVLGSELAELCARMDERPDQLQTYTDFCKKFDLPEMLSCMKMLHAFSENGTGDIDVQMNHLIERVVLMQERADVLRSEERAFRMKLIFAYPVLAATGKLLADLTVGMALMMQVLGGMGGA